MQLYNFYVSPFAARVRIAIYGKGLDVEIMSPPGGLRSAEYKSHVPTSRVPALAVDGTTIVESGVICEYLEERYPEPEFLPADPMERAKIRSLAQVCDIYLMDPTVILLRQLRPGARNPAVITSNTARTVEQLDIVNDLLGRDGTGTAPAGLTLADCALFPHVLTLHQVLPALGGPDPFDGRSHLASWWESVQAHDAVKRVRGEVERAIGLYRQGEIT